MKMMQRQALSSSHTVDHLTSCIPTNKNSRLITKQKPQKIRIIHIIPPVIIQTDKASFRNLVQSLTGQSSTAANTRIKKHQRPYLSGFTGSSHTECNPNDKVSDNPNHEQLNLDAESGHENVFISAKVEKDEMMVQAAVGTEWGMKDKLENGFCIDEFLELDEWLHQEIKFPNLMPNLGSNWGIDLFGKI